MNPNAVAPLAICLSLLGVFVLSYIVAAVLFFYHPELLHKQKYLERKSKKEHNFIILFHRGGACEVLENTIDAFEHAQSLGVDLMELDCHITKDDVVVVTHDNDLYRLCGVKKLISDLNYDELPEIMPEKFEERCTKFTRCFNPTTERMVPSVRNTLKIAKLEEVFQKFPDAYFNLDVKLNNDKLIKLTNELVIKYNVQNRLIWGSLIQGTLKKLHKLNPEVRSFFSTMGLAKLGLLMVTGLLPFVSFKEKYLEIIYPDSYFKLSKVPFTLYIGLLFLKIMFIRKAFIKHLHRRGISVFVWVLNEEIDFERAIGMNVDGIMTDCPSKLIEYVRKNHPNLRRPHGINVI